MKKNRIKKILIYSFTGIFTIMLIAFLGLFIYSKTNKLQCEMKDNNVLTIYDFEFDMFKKIKSITKKVEFTYASEEKARYEYEKNVVDKSVAELNGKNIIYVVKDNEIYYKTLKETKEIYIELLYACKMVKK